MNRNARLHKKTSNLFLMMFNSLLEGFTIHRKKYWGKNGFIRKGVISYHKEKNKTIEKSNYNVINYSLIKLKINRQKIRLKKFYSHLSTSPDIKAKYVIFTLNYQPEMTSSPTAGIFVDIRFCVDIILQHIPSDYMLYIKEHPSQFYSHQEGHTSRDKSYYTDLISNKRVKLIPVDSDPFFYISHSQAVATLTGTPGWEAMVLGKPVIMFGLSWYESFSGVLKINNEKDANHISDFIKNYKFDENELLAYLVAFNNKALRAYFRRGEREKFGISVNESISNLTNSIIEITNNA